MLVQPAKASLRVEPVNQHTPTSEEQSADPAGSRSWTRRARSGTPGGKWCMPLRSATSSSSVFRGYRFAANSVMPETRGELHRGALIQQGGAFSDLHLRSPISNLVGEACQGGNRRPSKGMLFSFHTFKRISTLFSRHFAISSRRTRSLGAFGAMSTSPSPARDLEVPMSAAQDLYLQLKISEFCERCCVWKISDRHLRSPLNKSTGVPQRS